MTGGWELLWVQLVASIAVWKINIQLHNRYLWRKAYGIEISTVFIHAFLPKLGSIVYKGILQCGWVDPASPPQPPAGPPDQWYVNRGQVSMPGVWAPCISMLQSWRSSMTPKFKLFSSFIDVADSLPKTCFNVRTSGGGDGYYILDPEQDGLDPISVFCNVSRTPVTAVLHHNQENWTHVHGYEDVGSYNGQVRHVTNAGLDGNNIHVILLLTCNNFI